MYKESIVYQVVEFKIQFNGKHKKLIITEFDSYDAANNFKKNTLKFRPNLCLEVEEYIKKEEITKPFMGFFDRIKECEDIKEEIKLLDYHDLSNEIIKKRLLQLIDILLGGEINASNT
jgi:hypothetical protein